MDVAGLFSPLLPVSAVGTSTWEFTLLMTGVFWREFAAWISAFVVCLTQASRASNVSLSRDFRVQSRAHVKSKRIEELLSWDRINFKFYRNHNVLPIKIWIFFYAYQETMSSFILRRWSFPQSREWPNFVLHLLIFLQIHHAWWDSISHFLWTGVGQQYSQLSDEKCPLCILSLQPPTPA